MRGWIASRKPWSPQARVLLLVAAIAASACGQAEAGSQTEEDMAADGADEAQAAANRLTPEEAAAGFELLFDGESLDAWRGFQMEEIPAGWGARDGALAFTPGVGGGTLITRDTYTDFDLRLEWMVGEGGNSGIFFGISENTESAFQSGPEMQVLDNAGHYDGGNPLTSAGSNYGLHAPPEDVSRPADEWNEVRIVRHGNQVVHWLNGVQVVDYEIGSDEWEALVAGSKFIEWPDYGRHHEGHLGLQDHGDPVWYRNIRVRRIQ
ncbi:3-keto-disaccharide hydrolase [Candidatus Palauibacter sp.]|uniref:3-keto-disaccharide hydrolase n=1 Tax=Candidatus Palauibacter sp. TaxID=3101350 RepID=UPI003B023BC0